MASKIKGLQQWCARKTDGYRDVNVTDMSISWRDGLAFCAIIHRFRPDLIDFDSLSKENIFENNQLAFEVAEKELDIPAFLDAPDMVRMKKPDKLSIVTYVSQYYNYFHDKPELGGPGVSKAGAKGSNSLKRPSNDKRNAINSQDQNKSKAGTLSDKCAICDGKVYLLERHIDNNILYHRLCFRHSSMSPTNKVYNSPADSNTSKVRKIDHKTGDTKKSLFPDKTKQNGSSNTSASKTPSKYHEQAMEFLSRENGVGDSKKNFLTSTPKSKYEDKTSLTIVSTNTDTKPSYSVLNNKPKSTDIVQSTKSKDEPKTSLSNKYNDVPTKKSDIVTSKTKDMTKLLEAKTKESQPETPKSGLRDFLKKYHEQGEKETEKEKKTNGLKDFDKMDVDEAPSPITRSKFKHNVEDKPASNTWEKDNSGIKSSVAKHKFDLRGDIISNKVTGTTTSTTNTTNRYTGIDSKPNGTSYQSILSKHNDKESFLNKSKDLNGSKTSEFSVNKTSKVSDSANRSTNVSDLKSKLSSDITANKLSKNTDISIAKPSKVTDFSSKDKIKSKGESSSTFSIFDKKPETRSDSAILDSRKKHDMLTNKTKPDKSYLNSKDSEPSKKVTSPVPKPRGVLKSSRLEEDMDTTESSKMSINLKPSATPRTVHKISTSDERSSRPKSPVLSRLKLSSISTDEISKTTSSRRSSPDSPPPPLPFSPPPVQISTTPTSPPSRKTQTEIKSTITKPKSVDQPRSDVKLKISQDPPPLPRKSYLHHDESPSNAPALPPRNNGNLKITSQETFVIGQIDAPPKPPRSPNRNNDRKEIPMSVNEAISKAMSPQTSPEPVAVLVSPTSNQDQNILGGLLKSLAGVRQKSPPEVSVQKFDFNSGKSNDQKSKLRDMKDQEPEVKLRRVKKDIGDGAAPIFSLTKNKEQERPKSVHSILDTYNNNKSEDTPSWKSNVDSRSSNRPKSVAMLSQKDDDIPSWKKSMELKKTEKSRTKSEASAVEDPNDFGKLTWQRDAAKRMAKNKHFVDPEFEKVSQKSNVEDKVKIKVQSDMNSIASPHHPNDKRKLPETPFSPKYPVPTRKAPERPKSPVHSTALKERPKSPVNSRGLRERPKSPVNVKKAPERPKSPPKFNKTPITTTNEGFHHVTNELDKKNQNNKYRVYPDLNSDINPPNPGLRKITPNIRFDFEKSMDVDSSVEESNNKNNNPTTKLTSPKPPPLKIDISPRRYSPFEIRSDLIDIDNKLTELELRGRQLEDTIRNATTSEAEDDLMNEWFKLINEKNELVRQEADLIYINREQELEDEQDSIDSRLRYLMQLPDEEKTQDERDEEDYLINKKIDVINQRSNIIDSIDEDRIRYEEEDRDIAKVLKSKGFDLSGDYHEPEKDPQEKKKKKKHIKCI